MKNLFKGAIAFVAVFFATQLAHAQQKIGHLNLMEIIQSTPEFKTAEGQLKTLSDGKTKELQDMYAMYQTKQKEANDKARNRSEANKETVDLELQKLGNELRDIETRINENQRVAQEDLNKKEEELISPIHKKVTDAITLVSKEKGFAYVFDISSTNIPYFQGGDDLTADVKTKLGISSTAATPAKK
ncbi:OmpH family outer membrane protein [Sphingobacterium sp. SG20118]|uniref:OmpH family outer membrane protein n=1 Tax=Sphingobacterium TaxID=28453 RepID=UPI0024694753|nr:OmpH family outer membrane protein [Sphingobacterium faecium]MDH5827631.1 OmpH family outer membrane protein [Sphingobacterium faecium]